MTGTASRGPVTEVLVDLEAGRSIHGMVAVGYERVLDVFVANFRDRRDLGAACAVYRHGEVVVHLWGGLADARSARPWAPDTAAVIFSCSKGVLSICAYLLAQDGLLDLDSPISRYWPAFERRGKDTITVRDAMSHRAGLPALDVDLTREQVIAWHPVIRALEGQRPVHAPTEGHLYHPLTFGWIVGEVIRRITGVTPGRYLQQTLAPRLGLRTWIGLPEAARSSVAWMEPPLPDEDSPAARDASRIAREHRLIERSTSMGGAFAFPAADGHVTFNDPDLQAAEIPGANGISSASSLARLYAACVSPIGDRPLLTRDSIADATRVLSAGPQLSGLPDDGSCWGTGFQLASPPSQPMLGPGSFGHAGAGGQLAFADIDHEIGFAYLSNQMGGYGDERAMLLTLALRDVLGA